MWWHLGAAVAGALYMGSRAPQTRVTKAEVFGSRTGHKWHVEFLEDVGAMVVIHPKARLVFKRSPEGWKFVGGKGSPEVGALIRKDFEGT